MRQVPSVERIVVKFWYISIDTNLLIKSFDIHTNAVLVKDCNITIELQWLDGQNGLYFLPFVSTYVQS